MPSEPRRSASSTDPYGAGLALSEEAREALVAAGDENRELTETERAIAGAEALTPQEALASVEVLDEATPGSRRPMVINLGPQHPSTHGVLRLITELDGEVIRDLHAVIGYLHTGIEKQCENKTYWQGITLVTRMDYLASYFNIHAYTMAVERLLELEVPARAEYLRVIMSELNRITSHLVWLGTSGLELGAITLLFYTYREREKALDINEMVAGDRMNPRYFQVGGCSDDLPPGFEARLRAFLDEMPGRIDDYEDLLSSNPIWLDRTKGIGVLAADELIDLGVTGPALRAAGVDLDLRKTMPYSGYEHFDFQVPLGVNGDAYDRYAIRVREMRESVRIIGQALDGMPEGRHIADDRRVVLPPRAELATSMEALIHHFKLVTEGFRVPEGEAYAAVESPRGELACYVVADGSPKPRRVHVRDPSFVNLQALRPMARGAYLADLITMIGSLDNVMGGVDR
jgi:NADH-quinone oxidoreductase subunit D